MMKLHVETTQRIKNIVKRGEEFVEELKKTADGKWQHIQQFISFLSKMISLIGNFQSEEN